MIYHLKLLRASWWNFAIIEAPKSEMEEYLVLDVKFQVILLQNQSGRFSVLAICAKFGAETRVG